MTRSISIIILFALLSCEKNESFTLETIIFPDLSGTLNIYGGTFQAGEEIILEAFASNSYTKDYINKKSSGRLRTDLKGLGGLY